MTPPQLPTLVLLVGEYAICRLPVGPVPRWAMGGTFVSITRTAAELSIVCDRAAVPAGVTADGPWQGLAVRGPLDLTMTGVLAGLAAPLATAGVSVFAVSTYDTDYLLVPALQMTRAVRAVREAGYTVTDA